VASPTTDLPGNAQQTQEQGLPFLPEAIRIGANRFRANLNGKYKFKATVEPAEVDRKFAEIKEGLEKKVSTIMNDPRMKAQLV
jgi:hypothetical protein